MDLADICLVPGCEGEQDRFSRCLPASGGGKARHKETEYGDEIAVCQLRLTGQIQPGLFVYTLSVAAFGLQRKDSVVATESMQSARQKVFTLQPLRKFIKETFGKRSERSRDGSGRSLEAVSQESEMMRFSLLKLCIVSGAGVEARKLAVAKLKIMNNKSIEKIGKTVERAFL